MPMSKAMEGAYKAKAKAKYEAVAKASKKNGAKQKAIATSRRVGNKTGSK